MSSTSPSQKADKFLLRLPEGIRDLVAKEALANNRTMTKEMVLRLQASFEPQPTERIKELQLQLAQQNAKTLHEQSKLLQYSAALTMIASRVPPEAFADSPALVEILKEASKSGKADLLASVRDMLANGKAAAAILDSIKPD